MRSKKFIASAMVFSTLLLGCPRLTDRAVADTDPVSLPVNDVRLNVGELRLLAGGRSASLYATILPNDATNKEIRWASSDPTVATIVDGQVTPLREGSSTITVTTTDGDKSDACLLTVTTPLLRLSPGTALDVSNLNGVNGYALFTVKPGDKPESNGALLPSYSGYVATTQGASSGIAAPDYGSIISDGGNYQSSNSIFSEKYVVLDEMLRHGENAALLSQNKQYNPAKNTLQAQASVEIGTALLGLNIIDFSDYSYKPINATCRKISAYAYFYIEDGYESTLSGYLDWYADAFDAIHAIENEKFGVENDVDANGRVNIIFSHYITGGVLGYFNFIDKYPSSTYPYSNTGDFFYITADRGRQGNYVLGTLAHEFQHMIYFDQHYNNGVPSTFTWLNEALSQAAEYYTGYTANHLSWIKSFLKDDWRKLCLTRWTSANYGYGAVFIRYIIDQYGDSSIKSMCSTDKTGIAAVEAATRADFNAIFHDFSQALVVSGTGASSNALYNFKTLSLKNIQHTGRGGLLPFDEALMSGDSENLALSPYCLFFKRLSGSYGTLELAGDSYAGTVFGLND
jgi:hypothetical protein